MNFQILQECHDQSLKIDLIELIKKSLDFIKLTSRNSIIMTKKTNEKFINGDEDQLNRVL